jgi:hypothetical protein
VPPHELAAEVQYLITAYLVALLEMLYNMQMHNIRKSSKTLNSKYFWA